MRSKTQSAPPDNPTGVSGPPPARAGEKTPRRYGSVYVGKLIRFDIVGGQSRASEEAKVRQKLLLDIEANPAATRVAADGRNVGRLAGYRSQLRGILVAAPAAAAQKTGDRDFARLSPEIMAPLNLTTHLKL